jgi:hypothetical protein
MIIRPTQKLASKIKVSLRDILAADPNPFADWSASLFTVDRLQYVILTNTASLYSTLMSARGASDERKFLELTLSWLREFMAADGLASLYERFVAPSADDARFSKALNRSVTGSINDLIFQAKYMLANRELSLHDASRELNKTPMSAIKYENQRKTFMAPKVGMA